jgi:hypothetical protein
MAAINTRNYAWKDCEIRVGGRLLTSVQGVSWNTKQEKEYIYGKGTKPLAVKEGNEATEGTLTVLQDELEQMLDTAPDGKLTKLKNLDIQVAFSDEGAVVRYSIIGVSFTEEPHDHKQNDKVAVIALPFMALDSKRA